MSRTLQAAAILGLGYIGYRQYLKARDSVAAMSSAFGLAKSLFPKFVRATVSDFRQQPTVREPDELDKYHPGAIAMTLAQKTRQAWSTGIDTITEAREAAHAWARKPNQNERPSRGVNLLVPPTNNPHSGHTYAPRETGFLSEFKRSSDAFSRWLASQSAPPPKDDPLETQFWAGWRTASNPGPPDPYRDWIEQQRRERVLDRAADEYVR